MRWYDNFKKPLLEFANRFPDLITSAGKQQLNKTYSDECIWRDEYLWPLLIHLKEHFHQPYGGKKLPFTEKIRKELHNHQNEHFNEDACTLRALDQVVECKNSELPTHQNNDEIVLIVSYYEIADATRKSEIDEALQANINNEHINRMILFVEENTRTSNEITAHFNFKNKVTIIPTKDRLTYKQAIDFAKNEKKYKTVYILANTDCYYDNSIVKLLHVNFKDGNRVLSFTRKDRLENGQIIDAVRIYPTGYDADGNVIYKFGKPSVSNYKKLAKMPPFSSDAWAFKFNINIDNINVDFELGRMACEQQFLSLLQSCGHDLRNVGIGGHVKCIHLHESGARYEDSHTMDGQGWMFRVPYHVDGNFVTPSNVTEDNYITGANLNWHPNNFYFDDRTSGDYGKYFVRNIKELF